MKIAVYNNVDEETPLTMNKRHIDKKNDWVTTFLVMVALQILVILTLLSILLYKNAYSSYTKGLSHFNFRLIEMAVSIK